MTSETNLWYEEELAESRAEAQAMEKLSMITSLIKEAQPHCCEEAALGVPFYAPCNKPATSVVGWKGRSDQPIRMCSACTDHNVKNRGGVVIRAYRPMTHYVLQEGGDRWCTAEGELGCTIPPCPGCPLVAKQ